MKKLILCLMLVVSVALVGCGAVEGKEAWQWARDEAVEKYEEERGRDSVVSVEEYDYSFMDGEFGYGKLRDKEAGTVSKVFKISFTILEVIEQGGEDRVDYFVMITWKEAFMSGERFTEDKIVSIEIQETREV